MKDSSAAAPSIGSQPSSRAIRAWRRSWPLVAGLLAVALINILRCPQLLVRPRFWAEEGSVYFASAFNNDLREGLFRPRLGYFAAVPNAAATLASLVPLEKAPAVTTAIALLIQLLTSGVVLTSRSRIWDSTWKRLAVAIAIPLMAPMETWLTTISAQFWLCLATFAVLQHETETPGALRRWGYRGLLSLAGLTGVISCFLTPFFFWKALRTRNPETWVQTAVLSAASVLQLSVVIAASLSPERALAQRYSGSDFSLLWLAICHLVAPFAGLEFMDWNWIAAMDHRFYNLTAARFGPAAGNWPLLSLLIALLLVGLPQAALCARGVFRREERRDWLAMLTVTLLCIATSLHFASAPRYAFAPSVMVFALCLEQLRSSAPRWRRTLAGFLVGAALLSNLYGFRSRIYYDEALPRWTDQVQLWRAYPGYQPLIWPQFENASWSVTLDRSNRPASR